jgi:threonine dehydrogenase-like Zn-dependent dehydrogenase
VLEWAVEVVAKAGTVCLIGVYPPSVESFPIGEAMMKNLTLTMGNCNHRKYIPHLVELTRAGVVDPSALVTQIADTHDVIEAYQKFDQRRPGWLKVALDPAAVTA